MRKRLLSLIHTINTSRIAKIIILAILIVFYTVVVISITHNLQYAYHNERFYLNRHHLRNNRATDVSNPDSVQAWMTFDYINVVYRLPKDYLATVLGITNVQYPNLRISKYATLTKQSPEQLITNIKEAIRRYKK